MNKPLVTSLSMAFKRATSISDDVEEAKKEHRVTLKSLMDKYQTDVAEGKADGIRNAKELVDVIKMDLLLMGEATERTDTNSPVDELQITNIAQALNEDDPNVQALIQSVFKNLNATNDDLDSTASFRPKEEASDPNPNIEGGDNDETQV